MARTNGFYWVTFDNDIQTIAEYLGENWWLPGREDSIDSDKIRVISKNLTIDDDSYRTAFEQASKSVDNAHALLDAVRDVVSDWNNSGNDYIDQAVLSMDKIEELLT